MNRLADQTSPYLLQHKDNPVDWYPWGDEAFAAAAAQDRPILLSVGYSACHWCHVMAHESFEHQETADLMNRYFISVKVDREERPDVDDIYMQAVQAFNQGHGGWPMTVFLTPDGRPFYGGTYYPREARYGSPAFREVLEAIHRAYQSRRDDIEAQADQMTRSLDRSQLDIARQNDIDLALLEDAARILLQQVDAMHGGFGMQPKFPSPMNWEYLLRYASRTGSAEALHAVELTLQHMADGGIYDQIGGGFARYSVDREWLTPHFEKMLYDNAQITRLYLHTWQVTANDSYRHIAEETYDYILREMTSPEGGFYSATDADSEGEEGRFFVWTMAEVREALAPLHDDWPHAFAVAVSAWGITEAGNFEGSNILHAAKPLDAVAAELDISPDTVASTLTAVRDRLYAARTSRQYPGLDDKLLTSWNGMMIASLAEAGRVLGRDDYLAAAQRAMSFVLEALLHDGRLLRTYKTGQAHLNAYLEDYAHTIDALLELYQSTFQQSYFDHAVQLTDAVLDHFRAEDGGFFDTSDDHETLIVRPRALQDNAIPAGNNVMARQLLRLAAYTGEAGYQTAARNALEPLAPAMRQYPQAFGEALNAADTLVHGMQEIALVGNPTDPLMTQMLSLVHTRYAPNQVIALSRKDVAGDHSIPLLSYRSQRDGLSTAYVCRNFACRMPVSTVAELADQLG